MQPGAVAAHRLEGVGERVAVVQHRPQARLLALVLLDDVALSRQLRATMCRTASGSRCRIGLGVRLQVGEELRVEDDAVLDDLGQAAAVLAVGQRGQGGRVDPDADRLVEGADQVLGRADG